MTELLVPPATQAVELIFGGRYRLREVIGTGATATVHAARDELLHRDVAIKVFTRSVDDPTSLARQRVELRALARLTHSGLVTLFDGHIPSSAEAGEPGYLVLELVPGESLSARLRRGPLPADEVRRLGARLAEALAFLHGTGAVHRDVKPGNVLLGIDGIVKLSDFGIVALADRATMTAPGMAVGTAAYISPEQVLGQGLSGASDVYALGLVLLEALTGERCFPGPVVESALARLTRNPVIPLSVPAELAGLIRRMTSREPEGRPSADEVAALLASPSVLGAAAAEDGTPTEAFALPAPRTPVRGGDWWRGRAPRLAAVGAGVMGVLAVVLTLLAQPEGAVAVAGQPAAAGVHVASSVAQAQPAAPVAVAPAAAVVPVAPAPVALPTAKAVAAAKVVAAHPAKKPKPARHLRHKHK